MILYFADCRGNPYNKQYPHAQTIEPGEVEKLRPLLNRDYTATLFNEQGRDLDNFIKSDCLMLDCDNGGEDPEAWTTPEEIAGVFAGVGFFVHYSRHHNQTKHPGEHNEQSARPRFHCLFPISETTDRDRIRALKETANRVYKVFDNGAKDAARLFYGTEEPQAAWIPGDTRLDDFFRSAGIPIETDAAKLERERQAKQAESAPPAEETAEELPAGAIPWDGVISADDPPGGAPYDPRAAILSALDYLDPAALDYTTWLNIGLALHFEGHPCSTWDNWSARDSARYKAGDCEKRWSGFKDDRGAGNITGGTIIEEARARGWKYEPPEETHKAAAEAPRQPEKAQTETEGQTPAEDPKEPAEGQEKPKKPTFDTKGLYINGFLDDIFTDKYKPIPTGLDSVDKVLQGGFLPQTLTLIGAPPGTGKTSLCTMIFESAAKNGNKCLYINLEMSAPQLWARSLSRILYQREGLRLNALDILRAYKYGRDSETGQAICRAAEIYKRDYSPNLAYAPPGGLTTNTEKLMENVNNLAAEVEKTGERAPLLCIDYLQLLSGQGREEATEVIKRAVYLLKLYAINHNTVSLAIIAQSRAANKATEATQQAGRDSSALEYTADMQLQLKSDNEEEEPEEGTADFVKLFVTKSRFTPASSKRAAQRFQFYGGQSYLQPLTSDYTQGGNYGGKRL